MFQPAKERLLQTYHKEEYVNRSLELEQKREQFIAQFPPDELESLQGQELLHFFHGVEKRQGLFYHLEFGSPGDEFGSVAGGSALKYKVYRGDDGDWRLKGKGNAPIFCSEAQAIAITQKLADHLTYALDLVGQLKLENGQLQDWQTFEKKIEEKNVADPIDESGECSPIPRLGWAHKYLALVHPDLFSFHHRPSFWRSIWFDWAWNRNLRAFCWIGNGDNCAWGTRI